MNRVFIGVDTRNMVAATVLEHSIHETASTPVQVTQLRINQLPISRRGLTDFTFTRYLVPWLCDFKGSALFLDADMLLLEDINELFELNDSASDVMVVKNDKRFEWPSVMLFNCGLCQTLTPEFLDNEENNPANFEWAGHVGTLPDAWNHLVGYDRIRLSPKLLHYTAGVPMFRETWGLGFEQQWLQSYERCKGTVSWIELMGQSVHVPLVMESIKQRAK